MVEEDDGYPPETHKTAEEFMFSQITSFKIIEEDFHTDKRRLSLIAFANLYGYTFVASKNEFKGYISEDILTGNPKVQFSVSLRSSPSWISCSSDNLTLIVCCNGSGILRILFFDMRHLINTSKPAKTPFSDFELGKCNEEISDLHWNPSVENGKYLSICLSSGAFIMFSVGDTVEYHTQKPASFGATAVCWSPRGKQMMIGKSDGSLEQYTPAMDIRRTVATWECLDRSAKVSDVLWLSTFQVAVTYVARSSTDVSLHEQPNLLIVKLPSSKEIHKKPEWKFYEDPTYGSSSSRSPRGYFNYVEKWSSFVYFTSTSAESALMGINKDTNQWEIWNLDDECIARVPYDEDLPDEPFTIGSGFILTSTSPININGKSYDAMPILTCLSCDGIITLFHAIGNSPKDRFPSLVTARACLEASGERTPKITVSGSYLQLLLLTSYLQQQQADVNPVESGFSKPKLSAKPSVLTTFPSTTAFSTGFKTPLKAINSLTAVSENEVAPNHSTPLPISKPQTLPPPQPSIQKPPQPSTPQPPQPSIQKPPQPSTPQPPQPSIQKPPQPSIQQPPQPSIQQPPQPSIQKPPQPSIQKPPQPSIQKPPQPSTPQPPQPSIQQPPQPSIIKPPQPSIQQPPQPSIQQPPTFLASKPASTSVKENQPGNISSDAIQIVEDFQRELNHFLTNARLDEHLNSLGSPSFKVNHTLAVKELIQFRKQISVTVKEQHEEIVDVTNRCLESFTGLRSFQLHKQRLESADYRDALLSRPLDLNDQKTMKRIRSLYLYTRDAIREADASLNDQWNEYINRQNSKTPKTGRHAVTEERQMLHRALVNQTTILHANEIKLTKLSQKLDRLRLQRTTGLGLLPDRDALVAGNLLQKHREAETPPRDHQQPEVKARRAEVANWLLSRPRTPVRTTMKKNVSTMKMSPSPRLPDSFSRQKSPLVTTSADPEEEVPKSVNCDVSASKSLIGTSTITYGAPARPKHQIPSSLFDASVTKEAKSNLNNPPLVVNIKEFTNSPPPLTAPFTPQFQPTSEVPLGAAQEVQKVINTVLAEKKKSPATTEPLAVTSTPDKVASHPQQPSQFGLTTSALVTTPVTSDVIKQDKSRFDKEDRTPLQSSVPLTSDSVRKTLFKAPQLEGGGDRPDSPAISEPQEETLSSAGSHLLANQAADDQMKKNQVEVTPDDSPDDEESNSLNNQQIESFVATESIKPLSESPASDEVVTTSSGLFGSAPATTSVSSGLFGSAPATTSASSGLFGSAPATTSSSGLFGNAPATTSTPSGLFGSAPATTSSSGLFGSAPATTSSSGLFGSAPATTSASSGLFGSAPATTSSSGLFGSAPATTSSSGLFGSAPATTSTSSGLFGSAPATTSSSGLFGNAPATTSTPSGLFGSVPATTSSSGLFGSAPATTSSSGLFGSAPATTSSSGLFGSAPATTSSGLFGSAPATTSSSGLFGSAPATTSSSGLFGSAPATTSSSGLFGSAPATTSSSGLFGSAPATTSSSGLFGSAPATTSSSGLFGSAPATTSSSGLFGNAPATTSSSGLFGSAPATTSSSGLFGSAPATTSSSGLFGSAPATTSTSSGLFGSAPATTSTSSGLFGSAPATTSSSGIFGSAPATTSSSGLFGTAPATTSSSGLFGSAPATTSSSGLFGSAPATTSSSGLFGSAPATTSSSGLFGSAPATTSSSGLFGSAPATTSSSGLFGSAPATTSASSGLFGSAPATTSSSGLFGNAPATTSTPSGLFGSAPATTSSSGLFGSSAIVTNEETGMAVETAQSTNLFGTSACSPFGQTKKSLFGSGTGGFLSGLGSTSSTSSSTNPFASQAASSQAGDVKSIFGTTNNTTFGSFNQPKQTTQGPFGQSLVPSQSANNSFSAFNRPATGGFGAAPVFGATATSGGFGSKPVFSGTSPFGGFSSSSNQPFAAASGSGFAAYAGNSSNQSANTSGFAALAAGSPQQGSSGFGALASNQSFASTGSGFGGFGTPEKKSASFTQWR